MSFVLYICHILIVWIWDSDDAEANYMKEANDKSVHSNAAHIIVKFRCIAEARTVTIKASNKLMWLNR